MNEALIIKEREINREPWDFLESRSTASVHSLHPYPAKFIPEIPRNLIQKFGVKPGTVVFDPFCGSGTTLVEAQRVGIPSVGVDLNPVACLISKVKTQRIAEDFLILAGKITNSARCKRKIYNDSVIPNVDHWFEKDVQLAIHALITTIDRVDNESLRDALRFILSSIIVRVSNQESDTRYAAIEKSVSFDLVFDIFWQNCEKFAKIMNDEPEPKASAKIINKDICDVKYGDIGCSVGLVVTSPPYPNAYEYWLYHKYRMWWLGYDPIKVKESEIGARAHFFKKNHHTAANFQLAMQKLFNLLKNIVVTEGRVCIVVGRSIIHGKEIDNGMIVDEAAKSFGFFLAEKITRNISAKRKSFNLAYAKIKTEQIIIFRKG